MDQEHGVSITPVAFLVVQNETVKLLPVCHSSAIDKLLDYVPDLVDKANSFLNKTMNNLREDKKEEKKRENQVQKENEIAKEQEKASVSKIRPRRTKTLDDYEYEYDEQQENFEDEE